MNEPAKSFTFWNSTVVEAKNRCRSVLDQISDLPISKIADSCKNTLLKSVNAELRFLSRLSISQDFTVPISTNIGYLESIVHILQQSCISGISRVCKPVPLSPSHGKKCNSSSKSAHVDIVCTLGKNPVWFIVSDRNPKYISWSGSHRNKGLRERLELVLAAACSASLLKPVSVVLFFSKGLDADVSWKLRDEFGASEVKTEFALLDSDIFAELEGDWVNIVVRGKYQGARVFHLTVDCIGNNAEVQMVINHGVTCPNTGTGKPGWFEDEVGLVSSNAFCELILKMRSTFANEVSARPEAVLGGNLINFDTTALIALVSGVSNGGAEQLLKSTEAELRKRFKGNTEFIIEQAESELQNPILGELGDAISNKRGIICESVHLEFKELVSLCGGPNEKQRAYCLLKCLLVVPDSPCSRLMDLPTTRKLALKNKIVFGTGDHWHAPTLTANMGFVRAIFQTGMSLLILKHRPRALTGD